MPKRIPTPPPGDDEPRYLTVVHPYAISGICNMELPKDKQDFARWVACCIDKDAFYAIFHKPSSRGMVIIEIARDYPHFDRILGEHRWSEFLHKPSEEEKGRLTQVFYCTYNTGRIVQKNGWKRIDVNEAWFNNWSLNNKHIKSPYPPTRFCDVPVEDRTNHPLCRPLPGAVKPSPPVEEIAAPQPVVGSAAWIESKGGATTQSKPNPLGAWGKGAPKAQMASAPSNPTANAYVKKMSGIPQAPNAGARMPAVGGGPVAVKSSNVWQNTGKKPAPVPVATNWDESRPGTPVSASPATAPTAPPGLPAQKNAWASGTTSYPTLPPGLAVASKTASVVERGPDRAGNTGTTGWDSTGGASASSPDSDFGPDLTTATESDNPYAVHINFSESMEEEFHGGGIRVIEEDENNLRELDSIAPGTWNEPGVGTWDDDAAATGWDLEPLDAEDLWQQNQETEEPALCKAHGIICRKGICAEYARQLRLEEAEKRKAAFANRGKKGNRKNRGAGRKRNDENEDENDQTGRRTTQNNPFRGPGAPVKMNWRGAPRTIVSADAVEKREAAKAASDDAWGDSDSEFEPNADAVVAAGATDTASIASWDVSEDAYDPWATPAHPVAKANANGADGKSQGKKKPVQAKASSSWADQVDAELAAANDAGFSVTSKRGPKRGTLTASKASTAKSATSTAKSSTSGWGFCP